MEKIRDVAGLSQMNPPLLFYSCGMLWDHICQVGLPSLLLKSPGSLLVESPPLFRKDPVFSSAAPARLSCGHSAADNAPSCVEAAHPQRPGHQKSLGPGFCGTKHCVNLND